VGFSNIPNMQYRQINACQNCDILESVSWKLKESVWNVGKPADSHFLKEKVRSDLPNYTV
jgi:hypothetical protein